MLKPIRFQCVVSKLYICIIFVSVIIQKIQIMHLFMFRYRNVSYFRFLSSDSLSLRRIKGFIITGSSQKVPSLILLERKSETK